MLGLTKPRKSLVDILSTFNKAITDIDDLITGNGEEVSENNTGNRHVAGDEPEADRGICLGRQGPAASLRAGSVINRRRHKNCPVFVTAAF